MDPAPAKICVFCNQDCSRRPRSKDSRGRYMCNDCLARRRLKADAVASVESAAAQYDSERTMPAPEAFDAAAPTPLGLTRPARVPSEHDPIPMPPPEPPPPSRPEPVVRPPAASFGSYGVLGEGGRSPARHMAVVWVERGAPSPAELFEALTGRGIEAVEVSDAYMAVAEVCRLFRSRSGAAAPSDKSDGLLALVTVSPEGQTETCAVCEAVGRYAPGTPCWMFGPARAPRLRPILEGDLAAWKGAQEPPLGTGVRPLTVTRPAAPPEHAREGTPGSGPAKPDMSRQSASGPQLRLAGSDRREPEPKPAERIADLSSDGPDRGAEGARSREVGMGEGDDAGRPPLLSPEELAMLLGDEDAADR